MEKLTIVFVALFVAAVAAAPDNLLTNFKSLGHFKRAATLLKPLHSINQQKKNMDEKVLMQMLDTDHDNMLDVDEIKSFMLMSGAPEAEMDQYVGVLMNFDVDKNKKLDINELKTAAGFMGF